MSAASTRPTPPPTDDVSAAFAEALDALLAVAGGEYPSDAEAAARANVLALYAAAIARAEAAERALDAIGRHAHIGAGGDVVDDGPSPFMGGHR